MKTSSETCVKVLATPLGDLVLAATETAVTALVFRKSELKRLGVTAWREDGSTPLLKEAERQLREYFRGERTRFDLPLDLKGTDFQRRVWAELRKIPFGKTWSYQELAERVGNPRAVRAVGTANGRNPACIIVPCHRVVRLSGEVGGYAGGVEKKVFLLKLEKTPA